MARKESKETWLWRIFSWNRFCDVNPTELYPGHADQVTSLSCIGGKDSYFILSTSQTDKHVSGYCLSIKDNNETHINANAISAFIFTFYKIACLEYFIPLYSFYLFEKEWARILTIKKR